MTNGPKTGPKTTALLGGPASQFTSNVGVPQVWIFRPGNDPACTAYSLPPRTQMRDPGRPQLVAEPTSRTVATRLWGGHPRKSEPRGRNDCNDPPLALSYHCKQSGN
jgi:hypothetical protein